MSWKARDLIGAAAQGNPWQRAQPSARASRKSRSNASKPRMAAAY